MTIATATGLATETVNRIVAERLEAGELTSTLIDGVVAYELADGAKAPAEEPEEVARGRNTDGYRLGFCSR